MTYSVISDDLLQVIYYNEEANAEGLSQTDAGLALTDMEAIIEAVQ